MKYVCLAFRDEKRWDEMSDRDRDLFTEECTAYDDMLRERGHVVAVEGLQGIETATTLELRHGRIVISDGPVTESERHLAEIIVLDATDLNHAIQLISKHPSLRVGACFEVRPVEESMRNLNSQRDDLHH